jgi:hypothetical protein
MPKFYNLLLSGVVITVALIVVVGSLFWFAGNVSVKAQDNIVTAAIPCDYGPNSMTAAFPQCQVAAASPNILRLHVEGYEDYNRNNVQDSFEPLIPYAKQFRYEIDMADPNTQTGTCNRVDVNLEQAGWLSIGDEIGNLIIPEGKCVWIAVMDANWVENVTVDKFLISYDSNDQTEVMTLPVWLIYTYAPVITK